MVLIINQFVIISIHALREEGDELFYDAQEAYGIFLSTPSARRATVAGNTVGVFILLFLSTPSARRATRAIVRDHECRGFLSTPSARRATWRSRGPRKTPSNFYPRPPRGGRLLLPLTAARSSIFLSTPSARRATAKTETKSLFSYKLYNILHEFRRALIYNGSKNDPNHAK